MPEKQLPGCPFCESHATIYGSHSVACSNQACPMSKILIDINYWCVRSIEVSTLYGFEAADRDCERKIDEAVKEAISQNVQTIYELPDSFTMKDVAEAL